MVVADIDLVSLLPASNEVKAVQEKCPALYVFTGRNEDAAFFSIHDFNLLLDSGDQEEVPYWNFIRNYNKINVALLTRPSPGCIRGISTILARKAIKQCQPKIGACIGNFPPLASCNADNEAAKALHLLYQGLEAEGLEPHSVYAHPKLEPLTLYSEFGKGSLKMIALNPEYGSKDINALVNALRTGESIEKLSVSTSIAVILIWEPFDNAQPTLRILYPGACPLEKLYASFEKLEGVECFRHLDFYGAGLEKNPIPCNTRTLHRTSIFTTKPSPTVRLGTRPAIAGTPKTSTSNPKPFPKSHFEVKPRLNEQPSGQHCSQGTKIAAARLSASNASRSCTAPNSSLHSKTNANYTEPPSTAKHEERTGGNFTNTKSPGVPRKSLASSHVDEKTQQQADEDRTGLEKPTSTLPIVETGVTVVTSSSPLVLAATEAKEAEAAPSEKKAPISNTGKVVNKTVSHVESQVDIMQHKSYLNLFMLRADGIGGDGPSELVGMSNLITFENSVETNKPLIDITGSGASGAKQPGDNMSYNATPKTQRTLQELEKEAAIRIKQLNLRGDPVLMGTMDGNSPQTKHSMYPDIHTSANGTKYNEQANFSAPIADVFHKEATAQNALEDVYAREERLPPNQLNGKPPHRRITGLTTKPRLLKPLYFDAVFLPHYGTRPALLNENAAKTFATNVRSRCYILSGQNAEKPYILDGFKAAKTAWKKPAPNVYVVPTHSTTLFSDFSFSKNADLAKAGIIICPPAKQETHRTGNGNPVEEYSNIFRIIL